MLGINGSFVARVGIRLGYREKTPTIALKDDAREPAVSAAKATLAKHLETVHSDYGHGHSLVSVKSVMFVIAGEPAGWTVRDRKRLIGSFLEW